MIYLTTGANGAGKTLFTLRDVVQLQKETGRPVYYNSAFSLKEEYRQKLGWNLFEFKDWQSCPAGSIFFIDECQNDDCIPLRSHLKRVPDYIQALTEHRKDGYDFFFITQSPKNIDPFVRRIIGSPGWHRHLKPVFGTSLINVLTWQSVNEESHKPNSGRNADQKKVKRPSEYYDYYESAVLHTAKPKIPKMAFILIAAVALTLYFIYSAIASLFPDKEAESDSDKESTTSISDIASQVSNTFRPNLSGPRPTQQNMTPAQYLSSYSPRIPDLPYTAPRYDKVTEPVTAPYPAACVHMQSKGCKCYSQQGTLLQTSTHFCMSVVQKGFFTDWDTSPKSKQRQQQQKKQSDTSVRTAGAAAPRSR